MSIIRFLEPMKGDLFIARFVDYHFGETIFSLLGVLKASMDKKQRKFDDFSWNEKSLSYLDLCTLECENKYNR